MSCKSMLSLLAEISEESDRVDKLCELNIIEQVYNVCQTTIVQGAWESGQELIVHGWVYALSDGLVRDLNVHIANQEEMAAVYQNAIAAVPSHDEQQTLDSGANFPLGELRRSSSSMTS